MTKLVPILALTALTALAPTNKAEAHWCGPGWRFWVPFGIGVGVPVAVATSRYYYGPPYYPGYYYGYGPRVYYYGRGYSTSSGVQAALARRGYYHGAIDGMIGPQSRNAIRSYQASHNLPVTGSIDRPLLHALRLG